MVGLAEMQAKGKIRYIGVTNFDAKHLQQILDAGVSIASNQVQYSILDQRVEKDLNELAVQHNISYLCYGVVAGGFLSDRYWNQLDPVPPLENRSLTKYRLIIDEFGGYPLFQEALSVLQQIAIKYEVGIAEIATQFILQKPMVGAAIIGARNQKHLEKLQTLDRFELEETDLDNIAAIISKSKGPSGPFYALERDKTGKHGAIMKYNLNED